MKISDYADNVRFFADKLKALHIRRERLEDARTLQEMQNVIDKAGDSGELDKLVEAYRSYWAKERAEFAQAMRDEKLKLIQMVYSEMCVIDEEIARLNILMKALISLQEERYVLMTESADKSQQ